MVIRGTKVVYLLMNTRSSSQGTVKGWEETKEKEMKYHTESALRRKLGTMIINDRILCNETQMHILLVCQKGAVTNETAC